MKYKLETVKTLITDNNKKFTVGNDIAFTIFNKETNYHDHYIGEIREILTSTIIIKHIQINKNCIEGELSIQLEDIEKNSCNYVYVD